MRLWLRLCLRLCLHLWLRLRLRLLTNAIWSYASLRCPVLILHRVGMLHPREQDAQLQHKEER